MFTYPQDNLNFSPTVQRKLRAMSTTPLTAVLTSFTEVCLLLEVNATFESCFLVSVLVTDLHSEQVWLVCNVSFLYVSVMLCH